MKRLRSLQALYSLGLEFWLPLPLLGLLFWMGSGFMIDQVLSSSSNGTVQLQADTQQEERSAKKVRSIHVEIKKRQGFSNVKVQMANLALKELEFEFPTTEFSQIEAAISQELGLSPELVKKLVRYQLN
jgi:cell division protein FtsX